MQENYAIDFFLKPYSLTKNFLCRSLVVRIMIAVIKSESCIFALKYSWTIWSKFDKSLATFQSHSLLGS